MMPNEPINEELQETLKNKNVGDLNVKHFSRFGEFLVSFELSKHGWNIYTPVYDEYIDFLIHKYNCVNCKSLWNQTPALICQRCGTDYSISNKKNIKTGICLLCSNLAKGNPPTCEKCGSRKIEKRSTCNLCQGEIEMKPYTCYCGSVEYKTIFRTIQVKSSRIESKRGGFQYAVNIKPKDIIRDGNHFFIWCLIDVDDKPTFIVVSVEEFVEKMGDELKTISFLKDDGRFHFSALTLGKWREFHNQFEKLD